MCPIDAGSCRCAGSRTRARSRLAWSLRHWVGTQKRSLPSRSSSRLPPQDSMTLREAVFVASHVIRAIEMPSFRAAGRAARSIAVAWPRRRAVGRTS